MELRGRVMSAPRRIAVVTVARSDYGILRPVLAEIEARADLDLSLIVTGMHLLPDYGLSVREIEADGRAIAARVETDQQDDSPAGITAAMGRQCLGMAEALAQLSPDLLVVLGDRVEMLAAAAAATPFNLPIAHIHGGEASFGAIDDAMRHAVTKLSHLHFPATEAYSARIRQMGEEDFRITVSGAPGLDNIRTAPRPAPEEVAARFGFPFDPADPPLMVTFHPETRSGVAPAEQVAPMLAALAAAGRPALFTLPNADAGGRAVAEAIRAHCVRHDPAHLVDNLGVANYHAMLSVAPAMVGNSSSGIIEAASFELPVVNLGDRQAGRDHGANVLHAPLVCAAVEAALTRALDPAFREGLKGMVNPYGDGFAARRIADRLEEIEIGGRLLAKRFADRPLREAAAPGGAGR